MASRIAALLVTLALIPSWSATPRAAGSAPALIVVLVVDQMRADYIDRYGQDWTQGLARVYRTGAVFPLARYPYSLTVTCPGHATISTGAYPYRHGLIDNSWYDRESAATIDCTTDPDARLVPYMGEGKAGHSMVRLRVPTLADEMRAQLAPAPRIVSLSLKARSAMTLAGRQADVLVWLEEGTGWVTSSAYQPQPVPFVERFVRAHPLEPFRSQAWQPLLPASAYLFPDDAPEERPYRGWTPRFPHAFADADTHTRAFHERWTTSPAADAYLADLAIAALDELALGRRGRTDFLAVGFSATDLVGHRFGPRSVEVQDVLAALDRTIGRLLAALDRRVGSDRYVVALTADHGVAPIPEQAQALGLGGGRIDRQRLTRRIEEVLVKAYGPGRYLARAADLDIYFAPNVYDRLRADPGTLDAVEGAIRSEPGVRRVFRADDLAAPDATTDPARRASALSYYPGRSGDLMIVPEPYWVASSNAATHSTPYDYDQRVPLVFAGAGIAPGEFGGAASPADLAPTLAQLIGVTLAAPDGRVLAEALRPRRTRTSGGLQEAGYNDR